MNRRGFGAAFTQLFLLLFYAACVRGQTGSKPIRIAVDLRDATKYVFHATLEFPVKEGALTLVYPKWIPGDHAPTGPITDLTGLKFRAGGKEIPWMRDDVDMYAFRCAVPAGAETLEVSTRIDSHDAYFRDLRDQWSSALKAAHMAIGRPPYGKRG